MTPEETQALVDRLGAIAARFDMTATERYEQDSEAFYAATGYMARERRAAYEAWIAGRNTEQQYAIRDAAAALTALARDLAAARQERDAALAPPVVQDAAPEWCHAESPKPREDDDPFVCTLKRGHAGNHIAEDVYGQVQDSWPAAAKAGGEAVRLAREIVNSWACVARTKRDLDYIHACHKKIDALEAAAPTLSPAQRETLTIFADCIDDELSGSETRGFTEAVVAVDRERYDALRAALAATETPK